MIKPDIQRLLRQALRSVGSGCATQTDVDFVWQDVQSMVIRDMMTKDNLRPDGRGLIDSRPASYQVTVFLTPPLSNDVFCPACYVPTFVETCFCAQCVL
jgi:polyribonucleotide nucleotidyltransferase